MNILINLVLSALAVGIAAYLTPGVTIAGPWDALIVTVVLAVVNATIGLVLRLVALPLNIVTLGLVSFVIGILMIMLTDSLLAGFAVENFWAAGLFAIILAVVSMVLGVRDPA